MTEEFPSRAVRRLGEARHFAVHALERAVRDNVLDVAAALTYTSLLALVPLVAISVAVLTAFPVFNEVRAELQNFIFANFLPEAGSVVQENLTRFVSATGKLTAVGVVGLAVTAVLMLMTIESAFNTIFRVTRSRRLMARMLVYWTVLTLGPLFIGVSFSISSYLAAAGKSFLGDQATDLWTRVSWVMPYLLTVAAFTLLYATVPNRRVQPKDAFIGAVLGAALFAALRFGFLLFVANVRTYQTIYGALAALPLFLIWMYLSWVVVLFGAVITASLPEWRMRRDVRLAGGKAEAQLALALDILAALARTQRSGQGLSRTRLLGITAAAEDTLVNVLETLRKAHIVVRTAEGQWMLARSLADLTLNDLLRVLGLGLPGDPPAPRDEKWADPVRAALEQARRAQADALAVPLADLLGPHGERGMPASARPEEERPIALRS